MEPKKHQFFRKKYHLHFSNRFDPVCKSFSTAMSISSVERADICTAKSVTSQVSLIRDIGAGEKKEGFARKTRAVISTGLIPAGKPSGGKTCCASRRPTCAQHFHLRLFPGLLELQWSNYRPCFPRANEDAWRRAERGEALLERKDPRLSLGR